MKYTNIKKKYFSIEYILNRNLIMFLRFLFLVHEQTEVPWIDGQDVSRCPNCAKLFHLTRRQHHCRLCGSIICHDCSRFLPISTASKNIRKII